MSKCCKNEKNMEQMKDNFFLSSIKIVVEKECGYSFLIYLNESSTLIDLYRYVELFYQYCNENKILYEDKDRTKIVYKIDIKIKDFSVINKIKKDNQLGYKFYLNLLN